MSEYPPAWSAPTRKTEVDNGAPLWALLVIGVILIAGLWYGFWAIAQFTVGDNTLVRSDW